MSLPPLQRSVTLGKPEKQLPNLSSRTVDCSLSAVGTADLGFHGRSSTPYTIYALWWGAPETCDLLQLHLQHPKVAVHHQAVQILNPQVLCKINQCCGPIGGLAVDTVGAERC